MLNQVITVNKKKYAVGLFWQPVGAGFVPRTYARNLAKNIDKKQNLFTEYRSMVGLGARRLGHKIGMPSAAAEVLDSLTEYNSFLGVFAVGDLFYLVAVRNGVILADVVFDSQDKARDEYFKLSEIPDWNALFAPAKWGMPRAIEKNLSNIILGNAHAVLRPISIARGGLGSMLLGWVFVLLLLFLFKEPINQMINPPRKIAQINPELAEEYKRQIEEKNKELDEQFQIEKLPQPEPLVMPYEKLPNVLERAEVCFKAIGFLMQPVAGWVQTVADCGETHATVQFKRSFGTLGGFYEIATNLMPAVFVSELSENSLNVRATLPNLPTEASVDERDAETVLRQVQTLFQSIDASYDAEIVVDTLTNGVDTAHVNVVEIASESKLAPVQFMKIFQEFEGVYMSRCQWNVATRVWNYEVIIYAK